ncbi:hypothetical protein RIF29_38272 [Crotalaria pallida]|uniref:Uncharacterized protein n=1 Tax=Crotalaria pallida TaxID=3830 RepID=A0AAN9E4F0_CROPI
MDYLNPVSQFHIPKANFIPLSQVYDSSDSAYLIPLPSSHLPSSPSPPCSLFVTVVTAVAAVLSTHRRALSSSPSCSLSPVTAALFLSPITTMLSLSSVAIAPSLSSVTGVLSPFRHRHALSPGHRLSLSFFSKEVVALL